MVSLQVLDKKIISSPTSFGINRGAIYVSQQNSKDISIYDVNTFNITGKISLAHVPIEIIPIDYEYFMFYISEINGTKKVMLYNMFSKAEREISISGVL
jgi:hypothetical protein